MKTAIAFLTKDRVDLSRQSIEPLLQPDKFDLVWCDGSVTEQGKDLPQAAYSPRCGRSFECYGNVRGGAGAAIVFALTTMLNHEAGYDYLGLVENDVVLDPGWFDPTLDLFRRGHADGLTVGAVTARTYVDRVLFQRSDYAVMHNIGAGMIVFSRAAAQIVLNSFRSGWTADNRKIFCQLSGVDIGPFWAFRNNDHPLVADWHFDATLAAHGYASLAVIPSNVTMIGQDPPLAEQGLTIADRPVAERIDNDGFERYRERLQAVREGHLQINVETTFSYNRDMDGYSYLPHQIHMIGGEYSGDWRFKENRAQSEFAWVAGGITVVDGRFPPDGEHPSFIVPVYGLASLLVSGGDRGGQIEVIDEQSGYSVSPHIPPEGPNRQALQIPLPSNVTYRNIRVTALHPGMCFYRLVCQNKQPHDPTKTFDHSILPVPV